jgi:hypothetical protein
VTRKTALLAVATGIGLTGSGCFDHVQKPVRNHPTVTAAEFTRLPEGWRAFDDGFGVLTSDGVSVESYALSWAYEPDSSGWANRMPRNATAISVLLLRRPPDGKTNLCRSAPELSGFGRIRRLPLVLPKTTRDRQEGAPSVLEYRVFGRMDESYNVDLRVAVKSPHPSAKVLRRAQSVVDHIRFPRWPRPKRC